MRLISWPLPHQFSESQIEGRVFRSIHCVFNFQASFLPHTRMQAISVNAPYLVAFTTPIFRSSGWKEWVSDPFVAFLISSPPSSLMSPAIITEVLKNPLKMAVESERGTQSRIYAEEHHYRSFLNFGAWPAQKRPAPGRAEPRRAREPSLGGSLGVPRKLSAGHKNDADSHETQIQTVARIRRKSRKQGAKKTRAMFTATFSAQTVGLHQAHHARCSGDLILGRLF